MVLKKLYVIFSHDGGRIFAKQLGTEFNERENFQQQLILRGNIRV